MLLRIILVLFRLSMRIIADVRIANFERMPRTGGAIIVTNHLGRLDAMLGLLFAGVGGRTDLILMIAEKYEKYAIWRWFGKQINAIWLNRFEVDFKAMRQVIKRLRQGELLGLAPEGTRSKSGALAPGKAGAAYLALKTGLPILPAAVTGTEDRLVKARLKRLRRLEIKIRVGELFTLSPIDGQDRDTYLQTQTDEIMCRIAALLPPEYRGVYADHPRLMELLEETKPMAEEDFKIV